MISPFTNNTTNLLEPAYLTLFSRYILILSPRWTYLITLFYPLDMSIYGWSFSWRQAADNGPLASTFRTSIFNPVICPDYILIISLSRRNVNPILPHAFEHFRTFLFRASGCGQWAPRLNIQNFLVSPVLYPDYSIFLSSLFLFVEPTFLNPDVCIYGRSFSGCQATDSGPSPHHSKLIFNPVLTPDYISILSLSISWTKL